MVGEVLYWLYTSVFYCNRRVQKFFFREDEPYKTLDIVVPLPDYPWLSLSAIRGDTEVDVTDIVNSKVEKGQVVTPTWLAENCDEADVEKWEYIDSLTFEVCEIPSEGVVNEVKSKLD